MAFGDSEAYLVHLAGARTRYTGTTSDQESYKLVNTAANFDYVKPGWKVVNTSTSPAKATYVVKPDNPDVYGIHRAVLLEDDIFNAASGESYEILRPARLLIRPPYGLEPELSIIRWTPVGTAKASIWGVEVWANDNLAPPIKLEGSDDTKGLLVYGADFHPMYHAAIEIRNYNKRAVGVLISGIDKSMPIESSAEGG